MSVIKTASKRGTNAVRKLREQKLRSGLPFMINVQELASNECYLEFPNGSIKLISIEHAKQNMDVVRELSTLEAFDLRKRFQFSAIN